jgi:hypothetical protein
MPTLRVWNPVAKIVEAHVRPAERPASLEGKRIGLYWNYKSGGDVALERVRELLQERYPGTEFANFEGDVGFTVKYGTEALAKRVAAACDVVVGSTAD